MPARGRAPGLLSRAAGRGTVGRGIDVGDRQVRLAFDQPRFRKSSTATSMVFDPARGVVGKVRGASSGTSTSEANIDPMNPSHQLTRPVHRPLCQSTLPARTSEFAGDRCPLTRATGNRTSGSRCRCPPWRRRAPSKSGSTGIRPAGTRLGSPDGRTCCPRSGGTPWPCLSFPGHPA